MPNEKTIRIKIKICDKHYFMKICAKEEHRVREVSKLLDEKISCYINKYPNLEKQDLISMAAFDLLIEKNNLEKIKTNEYIFHGLKHLIEILNQNE